MRLDYFTLKEHVGHDVTLAWYGGADNPANIAIECETCALVLIDFDAEEGAQGVLLDGQIPNREDRDEHD